MKGDFVLKTFCGKIGFEQKGFKKMFMGFIIIFLRNLGSKNPMIFKKKKYPIKVLLIQKIYFIKFFERSSNVVKENFFF